jgi:hypothetical protein
LNLVSANLSLDFIPGLFTKAVPVRNLVRTSWPNIEIAFGIVSSATMYTGSSRILSFDVSSVCSLAAPQDLHRILGEDPVGRQQDQLLQLGLGNQHPIKRIVMMRWQLDNRQGMETGDLQMMQPPTP